VRKNCVSTTCSPVGCDAVQSGWSLATIQTMMLPPFSDYTCVIMENSVHFYQSVQLHIPMDSSFIANAVKTSNVTYVIRVTLSVSLFIMRLKFNYCLFRYWMSNVMANYKTNTCSCKTKITLRAEIKQKWNSKRIRLHVSTIQG
jgi:hypothetical protein